MFCTSGVIGSKGNPQAPDHIEITFFFAFIGSLSLVDSPTGLPRRLN